MTELLRKNIFENGIRNGLAKGYYKSGEIEWQVNYRNDLENGLYQEYFKSGNLKNSCWFINGLQDSILIEKYETGVLKAQQSFKNGIKFGLQKSYYDSGNLKLLAEWDSNIVVYYKKLNEDSSLIKEYRDIVISTNKSRLKLGEEYSATIYIPGFKYADSEIELRVGHLEKTKNKNNYEIYKLKKNTQQLKFTPTTTGQFYYLVEIMYSNEKGLHVISKYIELNVEV